MLEDRTRCEKVRLCLDGRLAATAATGVASYARALRSALKAIGADPLTLDDATQGRFGGRARPHEIVRRRARAVLPTAVRLAEDGRRLHARDVFRLAQTRFTMTGELLSLIAPGRPGIMHWTYPIPARIAGWINLYTVHDVIPLTDPSLSPIEPGGMRRRLAAIARRADRIVAVSSDAREAIVATLGLSTDCVVDCGAGVTEMDGDGGTLPGGLARGGYFLFCGLAEPRKNVPRIVAGWRASGVRRPLVLVGPDMFSVAPDDNIVMLPYLPRPAMIDLMKHARALVFPTLAEGFGLPVAEAMTLGTPVITSDRGALAETAGKAALAVDPTDTQAIAASIALLDRDDDLCGALARKGRARAAAFTPAAFGARLARLHDEFAGDSRLVR